MVYANKIIQSGFSTGDAVRLSSEIDKLINTEDIIEIDFSGVKYFTTLFFNQAITKYLDQMSVDDFNKRIVLKNLTPVGESTYKHSYDYAVEYYSLPPDKREELSGIAQDTLDEL